MPAKQGTARKANADQATTNEGGKPGRPGTHVKTDGHHQETRKADVYQAEASDASKGEGAGGTEGDQRAGSNEGECRPREGGRVGSKAAERRLGVDQQSARSQRTILQSARC